MIELSNVDSQLNVSIDHSGDIDSKTIYRYIHKHRKQLNFFGVFEDSLIFHDANPQRVFQFLNDDWSTTMQKHHNTICIKVMSSDYLCKVEELANTVKDLKGKSKAVEEYVNQVAREIEEKNMPKKKYLNVGLMWASPLVKKGNDKEVIIKYQTRYDLVFKPIMKLMEESMKNVKLNVEEFNKTNFMTAITETNIVYVHAHAEVIYDKIDIYGQLKEGDMEKFNFKGNEFKEESIDLMIVHSSCTDEFVQKIEKVARNLIVISSNVYCPDQCVQIFNKNLFANLLKGQPVDKSFYSALQAVKNTEGIMKTQCCCFHPHTNNCLRKNVFELNDADAFSRYHRKCHNYRICGCPQFKTDRLTHSKTCSEFKKDIKASFSPNEIDGDLNYCCCHELVAEHERKEGELLHSLDNKFKLKKFTRDFSFSFQDGECKPDVPSMYFVTPPYPLVESRKNYLLKCLRHINEKLRETTKRQLLLSFWGSQDKQELADYLFTVLLRKKIIKPTRISIDEEWNTAHRQKIQNLIKQHSFIVIKIRIQKLEQIISCCSSEQAKIVILLNQRPFLAFFAQNIQIEEKTPHQNRLSLKKNISYQQPSTIPRFYTGMNKKFSGFNVHHEIGYYQTHSNVDEGKLQEIRSNKPLYELCIILSYFGKLSGKTIKLLTTYVRQNQEDQLQYNLPFQSFQQQLFHPPENDIYSMKIEYLKVLKYSEKTDVTLQHPTIEKICYKYLYKLFLQEILKYPRYHADGSEKCGLFQATTLNSYSLLTIYLQKQYETQQQIQIQPIITLTLQQIFSFVTSLIEMKIKTQHHDFQLMVILALNYKMINSIAIESTSEDIWGIQSIFKFQNPLLGSIFLSFIIQTRLEGLYDETIRIVEYEKKMIVKLDLLEKIIKDGMLESIYVYIVSFDLMIGRMIFHSKWWNVIDLSYIQYQLKQYYLIYGKNRIEASHSWNDSAIFHKIDEFHGFKLNFINLLVNSPQFEIMYKSLLQAPTKQFKRKYKKLATYLEFLKKRDKIENTPKEAALELLWKWHGELEWRYEMGNLKFIRQKLRKQLLTKIKKLTSEVCYILTSFVARENRNNEKLVVVDYNRVDKINRLGFNTKEIPLTRMNLNHVLTIRCKYLVFWFQEDNLGWKDEITDQPQLSMDQMIKQMDSTKNTLGLQIQYAFVCSVNSSFSEKLWQSIKSLETKPINKVIYFNLITLDSMKKDLEEKTYLKKLIMNIGIEKMIEEIESNPEEARTETVGRVSSGICRRLGLEGNFIVEEFKLRGASYQPIEIGNVDHTVYKGMMQWAIDILKAFFKKNKSDQKGKQKDKDKQKDKQKDRQKPQECIRYNLLGDPDTIGSLLNFIQKVCLMNKNMFPGGIYRVNCKGLAEKDLPLPFIQDNLGVSLPTLKNKRALIILQSFDKITKLAHKRKTYDYLFELLCSEGAGISILATSEKALDAKFNSTNDKKYQNTKAANYEKKVIRTNVL